MLVRSKFFRRHRAVRRKTVQFSRSVRFLGRRSKQMLIAAVDMVALPAALWTAITLRLGTPFHPVAEIGWMYLLSIVITVPIFVRIGLYRAVIRFMGINALLAIAG